MSNHDCIYNQEITTSTTEDKIKENIGLVYTIVSRFSVSQFDRDDLIQAGLMGLELSLIHI